MPSEKDIQTLVHSTNRKNLPDNKNGKSKKQYQLLFRWIKNQTEYYDRAKFGEKHGFDLKAVRYMEDYLYEKLLDLAVAEENKDSLTAQIDTEIKRARVLEQRGLYKKALYHLKKAADKARAGHKYHILLDIIPRRINVLLYDKQQNREQAIEEAYQELEQITRIIKEEAHFRHLNAHWFILTEQLKTPDDIPAESERDYQQMLLKGYPENGSFFSQYYYYSIQAIYEWMHKRKKSAIETQQKVVALWELEEFSSIKKEHLQLYLAQLNNLGIYANSDANYELMKDTIDKMESKKVTQCISQHDQEVELKQNRLYLNQLYYLNKGYTDRDKTCFKKAAELVEEIEQAIEKHQYRINPRRQDSFRHNIILSFFFDEQYEPISERLKDYAKRSKSPYRSTHQQFVRILQMIVYYTINSDQALRAMFKQYDKDVNPSKKVDKLHRTSSSQDQLTTFEDTMVDFFGEIRTYGREDYGGQLKCFRDLQTRLQELPQKDRTIGYGETLFWVERMIERKQQNR